MTDISQELENASKGFSSTEYNSVARGASLESINLLTSRFDVLMESFASQNVWKLSYGRKVVSCHYSEEDRSVAGIFQYFVTAKHGRKRALHCVAEYAVFYEVPEKATEEAAKGYCHNVGTFAAYPYFRALFAQLVASAGLNPVHAMQEGDETSLQDLALLCANCHRIVHKSKPWLTIDELKDLIANALAISANVTAT